MKLVVGLGNPGVRYERTRHNIGFEVVDLLGKQGERAGQSQRSFRGELLRLHLEDNPVALLKPQTFMNRSGQSVVHAKDHFKLDIDDLIVIHDDLDLPFGTARVKVGGGSGGHRGLESCFAELGSREFTRIRCGIGRPPEGTKATDYVLDDFDDDEQEAVGEFVQLAAEAARETIRAGAVAAMNRFNRRTIGDGGEP